MIHIDAKDGPERASALVWLRQTPHQETVEFRAEGPDAVSRVAARLLQAGLTGPYAIRVYIHGKGDSDSPRPRCFEVRAGTDLAELAHAQQPGA